MLAKGGCKINRSLISMVQRKYVVDRIIFAIERFRLKKKDFIIVSNNCWGFELYDAMRRQYNSPFVGLFLFPDCYIQLLQDFENCIKDEIKFTRESKYLGSEPRYPIGMLRDSIEIHFTHYSSEDEAREKWNRRVDRLAKDLEKNVPMFIKFCDRSGCTKEHIESFHALPFANKISIGVNPVDFENHLFALNLKDPEGEYVVDGFILYRKRYHYFDIVRWISTGKCCQTATSRILSLIS